MDADGVITASEYLKFMRFSDVNPSIDDDASGLGGLIGKTVSEAAAALILQVRNPNPKAELPCQLDGEGEKMNEFKMAFQIRIDLRQRLGAALSLTTQPLPSLP